MVLDVFTYLTYGRLYVGYDHLVELVVEYLRYGTWRTYAIDLRKPVHATTTLYAEYDHVVDSWSTIHVFTYLTFALTYVTYLKAVHATTALLSDHLAASLPQLRTHGRSRRKALAIVSSTALLAMALLTTVALLTTMAFLTTMTLLTTIAEEEAPCPCVHAACGVRHEARGMWHVHVKCGMWHAEGGM